ncbi:hypothetical protein [Lysinibacillus xylanilyticus]
MLIYDLNMLQATATAVADPVLPDLLGLITGVTTSKNVFATR